MDEFGEIGEDFTVICRVNSRNGQADLRAFYHDRDVTGYSVRVVNITGVMSCFVQAKDPRVVGTNTFVRNETPALPRGLTLEQTESVAAENLANYAEQNRDNYKSIDFNFQTNTDLALGRMQAEKVYKLNLAANEVQRTVLFICLNIVENSQMVLSKTDQHGMSILNIISTDNGVGFVDHTYVTPRWRKLSTSKLSTFTISLQHADGSDALLKFCDVYIFLEFSKRDKLHCS